MFMKYITLKLQDELRRLQSDKSRKERYTLAYQVVIYATRNKYCKILDKRYSMYKNSCYSLYSN